MEGALSGTWQRLQERYAKLKIVSVPAKVRRQFLADQSGFEVLAGKPANSDRYPIESRVSLSLSSMSTLLE